MLMRRSIIKLGKFSKVVTLPKIIADKYKVGDIVVFDIHDVKKVIQDEIKEYICKKCGSRSFFKKGEDIYCTACGCEDMKLIGERK